MRAFPGATLGEGAVVGTCPVLGAVMGLTSHKCPASSTSSSTGVEVAVKDAVVLWYFTGELPDCPPLLSSCQPDVKLDPSVQLRQLAGPTKPASTGEFCQRRQLPAILS